MFVPAYWIYSVRYQEPCTLMSFNYRTLMSTLSVSPQAVLSLLQSQNTKHRVAPAEKIRPRVPDRPDARGVICPAPPESGGETTPRKQRRKRNKKLETTPV